MYRSNGIPLPGDLADALAYAPQVSFSQLEPGDILYFQNTVWNGLSHAAIYIGGGKFIHAEWYNRGVVISSFNSDPTDGNYWIGKYLGANRPWGGTALGTVVTTPGSTSTSATSTPGTAVSKQVPSGPQALVTVPSLNVRTGPSKSASVAQVVSQGATMTIIGKQRGWYKVQFPDGSTGWVIAAGIGKGGAQPAVSSTVATGTNGVANPTVGNVSSPARIQSPYKHHAVASVKVTTLRVHSGPSMAAPVVSTASQGQRMQILARGNGWMKVRLPNGTVGWVSTAYTSARQKVQTVHAGQAVQAGRAAAHRTFSGGTVAPVAVNVRTSPSLSAGVATVLPAGSSYRVMGWANGWMHVQLANGMTGWISGTVVGKTGASRTAKTRTQTRVGTSSPRISSGGSVVTAGVRVHAGPALNSRVVSMAAAGSHVQVLGRSGGWVLVRLASGVVGYVSGQYVR